MIFQQQEYESRELEEYVSTELKIKFKSGYYLELLTHEMMKSLGITANKITQLKEYENIHNLEISELLLVHYIIFNNSY